MLRTVNQSLFLKNDTLVLIDFFHKNIHYFTPEGSTIKTIALYVNGIDPGKVTVIKDNANGKFYLKHNSGQFRRLDEIDMETGRILPDTACC